MGEKDAVKVYRHKQSGYYVRVILTSVGMIGHMVTFQYAGGGVFTWMLDDFQDKFDFVCGFNSL